MTHASELICQTEQRRSAVRAHPEFNGLDYLEVIDATHLRVFFLKKAPTGLTAKNIIIKGGRRLNYRDIKVIDFHLCRQEREDLDDCLAITLDKSGDFSCYTLCLVALDADGCPTDQPLPGMDPRYACLDFSFKVDCPSDLDCKQEPSCPPVDYSEPEINYLARDYAGFRQLILDRLAVTMPEWQERHVPDIGITLVEIMAYVGDYLSYYQDAVATEAYLATARQRISVRRHARLVDYQMHEGCNARAWLHLHTESNVPLVPGKLAFITQVRNPPRVTDRLLLWEDLREIPANQYEVFEPLVVNPDEPIWFYTAHNEIYFYTWGDAECCLPRGATSATLIDGSSATQPPTSKDKLAANPAQPVVYTRNLTLKAGDILIFEEVIGPETGNPADADPTHRHAVRLTRVEATVDELYNQPVLEIEWAVEDALPFPLCLSTIGPAPMCACLTNVSVARGNVLLVDHGRRVADEDLGTVPVAATQVTCLAAGQPSEITQVPGSFQPLLTQSGVTFSQPLPMNAPAAIQLAQDPRAAIPWIRVRSQPPTLPTQSITDALARARSAAGEGAADSKEGTTGTLPVIPMIGYTAPTMDWQPQRDLLASASDDADFVAEIDNSGGVHLRFGNGELGKAPAAGEAFTATYRVGNGQAGNVGAEAIVHAIATETIAATIQPRNPLPATGGVNPESMADVKLFAPHAFRRELQRAITADDYAAIVMRDFSNQVQRAAAVLRWTGSWFAVLVVVDPVGQTVADPELLATIARHLYRFRRMGHDVVVKLVEYVPLDIELEICVRPAYLRGHVKAALQTLFSNRRQPNGQLGFFHPDKLTFGAGVYLSQIVAVAQAVAGVESVTVKKLERLFEGPNDEIAKGVLPLGALEIARLDNDPNFPENGRLLLTMRGGR